MYFLYIILIFFIIYIVFKKKNIIENGYWGPWGYSEKYEWIYPDGYKAYIPYKDLFYQNRINKSIYLPYEYWL
jgi:hypothetical protein